MMSRLLPAVAARMRPRIAVLALALLVLPAGVVACGGAEAQDENEPEGTWTVEVVDASFPGRQRLADQVEFKITIRNADDDTIPNLAVTVDGFDQRRENTELADPRRPIWVIDEGPDNATTAFTNTWAVGEVPANEERTLVWRLSSVRAGTYTLRWRVAAGLDGKAKATLAGGDPASGSFIARVSEKPHPVGTIE
jgi:hypothetical protein